MNGWDPVFPIRDLNEHPGPMGLALRDYFAAAALPVMWSLTQFALQSNINGSGKLTLNDGGKVDEDMLAKGAYAIADAMLKAGNE